MVDNISLKLKSGRGGRGSTALWRGRRPYGGDGGKGGDVYLEGSREVFDFSHLMSAAEFHAENGQDGLALNKYGAKGDDLTIKLPLTTEVICDGEVIHTISEHGQRVLFLKGGRASKGNLSIKKHPTWTMLSDEERTGNEAEVTIRLKLSADILFLGYPNAGKSSLLNKLTNARAKVGAYEFTTLEPQLGRMGDITLMDLPGLIEGTHKGRGLGTGFLQHTESALLIAHIIGLDTESPIERYKSLRSEIEHIDSNLAARREVVILTKSDECSDSVAQKVLKQFSSLNIPAVSCTILDEKTIQEVKQFLAKQLDQARTEVSTQQDQDEIS